MGNYYCLMAGVPDIALNNTSANVSVDSFREELEETISPLDSKIIFYFFLRYDCLNLVRLLKDPDAKLYAQGNYSLEQFQDMITSAREMNFNVHRYPAFMSEFARSFDFNMKKPGFFPEDELLLQFYEYAQKCPNKMVAEWYRLNHDINNILTAFIARRNGWNVAEFVKGDNAVTEMILNNNTSDFNLSLEYDYVRELMKIVECSDPVEKEKRIDAFKWNWLDEKTFFNGFSVEAVFAYLCKLDMLYRWDKLDPEKGKETFRQIIEDIRGGVKVPEEFQAKSPFASAQKV